MREPGRIIAVSYTHLDVYKRQPVEAVKQTVEEIRKNEEADMIACVSHSGTWDDENKSEDELLAKAVPDIDLIISGHTHSELPEAIQHGNTYIAVSYTHLDVYKRQQSDSKESC